MTVTPSLFDPIRVGCIEAANRIFMAPLTRARATRENVPTPIMAKYYAQRASAGLIISEATGISRQGLVSTRQQQLTDGCVWRPNREPHSTAGGGNGGGG